MLVKLAVALAFLNYMTSACAMRFSCEFTISDHLESVSFDMPHEELGKWSSARHFPKKLRRAHGARSGKKVFLLSSQSAYEKIFARCQEEFKRIAIEDTFYFSEINAVLAYSSEEKGRCNGHDLALENAGEYILPFRDYSLFINDKLSSYNFDSVVPRMIYRSAYLGRKGMEKIKDVFAQTTSAPPRSIASIHVMGYGGDFGSYNLEEMEECAKNGITFLHSYSSDPKLTVFMDGTDPSKLVEESSDHGNIYESNTLKKFVPDAAVQSKLAISDSLKNKRVVKGDTADFLQSIENIIDAPWPILIHCKGGRHKTGMFSMVFEYLFSPTSMNMEYAAQVAVPQYRNRLAMWWKNDISFFDALRGDNDSNELILSPAELHYFQHNNDVFRKKNIDFVRGLISGALLTTPELQEKWRKVQRKCRAKSLEFSKREAIPSLRLALLNSVPDEA